MNATRLSTMSMTACSTDPPERPPRPIARYREYLCIGTLSGRPPYRHPLQFHILIATVRDPLERGTWDFHLLRLRQFELFDVTHNRARMVVVASGSPARIKHWSNCLRAASIVFLVENGDSAPFGHAEIWVGQDDVEEARAAIRSAPDDDHSLLW